MSLFTRLKQFDAYSKTLEDFKVKTFSGATSEKSHNNITLNNVYIIYIYIYVVKVGVKLRISFRNESRVIVLTGKMETIINKKTHYLISYANGIYIFIYGL